MRHALLLLLLSGFVFGIASLSSAQASGPRERPPAAVEVTGGYAGFVDDATIRHGVAGGAFRYHLTPRVSVGPEMTYMIGPGGDRDFFLTGNVTFDLRLPEPGRAGRATPFLVAGGGLMRHSDSFGGRSFSSTEGALTGGGGVRVWISPRVYAAAELRIGWEPHVRITGTIGVALPD